jgi:[acyl-carrier-protein] S-malonyltransferase
MKPFLVFPGQGAQAVGMGKDFIEASPACRDLFQRASAILGFDLAALCAEGPIEELTRSCNTQPAIFAVSVAARTALAEAAGLPPDWRPAAAAGLSSGEWAALHEAGVVTFEDAVRILQARGQFMQEACEATPGGMVTVIGLPAEKVAEIAASVGLEVANYNSPLQTVMSGHADRLADGEAAAKAAGAKRALRLTVAGAFHSSLMRPAADRLAAVLDSIPFAAPSIPVWSNVTGKPHSSDVAEIRRLMVEQVASSVRWADDFASMAASGLDQAFECGPGTVLAGLAKRITPTAPVAGIFDLASAREASKLFS